MVGTLILLSLAVLSATVGSPGPAQRGQAVTGAGRLPRRLILLIFPVLVLVLIAAGTDPASLIALLIVLSVAGWQIRRHRSSRARTRRARTLVAFLGSCAGNLRAGLPMAEAMSQSLDTLPETAGVSDVLGTAARRARSGAGPEVLVDAPAGDLRRLGELWAASEHHGLPLVALIEQMRAQIDTGLRHRAATAAALQGPQATAVILSLLPVAGVVMGTAMGADPLAVLTGGGIGGMMLVGGVTLGAAGFLLTQKILAGADPT